MAATNLMDSSQLAYNLKTTVEAYDKISSRSPKWDATARSSLIAYSQFRSWTNANVPTAEQIGTLRSNATVLAALKCDDALIRYLQLRIAFAMTYSADQMAAAFEELAPAMQKSAYPDIRKFYATQWAYDYRAQAGPKKPEQAATLKMAAGYLSKALDDPTLPAIERDQACAQLMAGLWWPDASRWECYQIIERSLTNRWNGTSTALLAKGRAYLTYAWQARGTGYANTVSDDGWKLMRERLQIAAEALEAAWKINPTDPAICLEMMRVELGESKGRDRLETWFQRGMKLAPASYDICYQKLEYLRPRWYGSMKEMVSFGRECTLNTNYSGTVRLMLADAHYEAVRELRDAAAQVEYWKRPSVWADIRLTFEQFFKLYPEEDGYRHNYARYAVWCEQWQSFLDQTKLFTSTNYAYFQGEAKFKAMVNYANEQVKKH